MIGVQTDGGETTSDDLLNTFNDAGKEYVGGYEIEKNGVFCWFNQNQEQQKMLTLDYNDRVGNTVKVSNVFNTLDVTPEISGKSVVDITQLIYTTHSINDPRFRHGWLVKEEV